MDNMTPGGEVPYDQVPDIELPGMWERADFMGGDPDERSYAQRARDAADPKSKAVARWADKAMFGAEPIEVAAGPKVHLLWMTPDPLGAIAAACSMYEGRVVTDLLDVTDEQRLHYFRQVQNTKLKAPFEFVKFHFLIEGVTRAFTHQLVRQRTAVYAQESLRFAVKEDMPVGLPPAISAAHDRFQSDPMQGDPIWDTWGETIEQIGEAYRKLVNLGVPAEDARGLLPHNVLTRVHYSTDLRALIDHAGNRLCTQAQFEWRLVFARIAEAIRNASLNPIGHDPHFDHANLAYGASGKHAWMAKEIADLFRPVCYQTGRCEFKADFDRRCSIRERVDANEQVGRKPAEWGTNYDPEGAYTDGGPRDGQVGGPDWIRAIRDEEWLANPNAAR